MDDFINVIVKPGILKLYWRNKLDNRFQDIVNKSSVCLSISQGMSGEYQKRDGKEFFPVHNPVDPEFWHVSSSQKKVSSKFNILYSGRVGTGTSTSLLTISQAIEYLLKKNVNVTFTVSTNTMDNRVIKKIEEKPRIILEGFCDYNLLPKKFSQYDLLIIPYDFDDQNHKYIKYSMPTKATEYMVTGIPVLVFGPKDMAIMKDAIEKKWAAVVSENDYIKPAKMIELLMNDVNYRNSITENAPHTSFNDYNTKRIKEDFLSLLKKQSLTTKNVISSILTI